MTIPPLPALLTFGLGFGLGGAWLGHANGLLALGIVARLLQGALADFGACAPITRPPALKLVLAVGWRKSGPVRARRPVASLHMSAQVPVRLWPLSCPPPAPHLTSKLFLPVAGHPAPAALGLGPAGALAEPHAAVLAAGGAGPPGPLRALAPWAALLHLVYKAWGTELRTRGGARGDSLGTAFLGFRAPGLTCPSPALLQAAPHHLSFWPPQR